MDKKLKEQIKKQMRKALSFKQIAVDEKEYTISGVFSTGGTDRHGEIIDQNGWKTEEFMQNPVVLFAHDQSIPAVGKVIELGKDGSGNLTGVIKFAVEASELAATLFKLYAGGFMRAFSVGFANDLYEFDQTNETVILKENTLYELSCVNVPANAMALAYSKGIDVTPIKTALHDSHAKQVVEKAGRVLSATNRQSVITAVEALQAVLDADSKDDPKKNLSPDNTLKIKKVETPASAGGRFIKKKRINKAIRDLLETKRGL